MDALLDRVEIVRSKPLTLTQTCTSNVSSVERQAFGVIAVATVAAVLWGRGGNDAGVCRGRVAALEHFYIEIGSYRY